MGARVAVIYYSATGNVAALAKAIAEGVEAVGAEVRLRRVPELAPPEAIATNPIWQQHHDSTQHIPVATLDDLEWANAFIFGTPTRFGNVSAQLKQFLDMAGPLWAQGKLANKVASGFTSASNDHGGQETTLTSLYQVMYHWGAIVITPGYTHPDFFAAGGNPYGVSVTGTRDGAAPAENILVAARQQGRRVAELAARLDAAPA